MNKIIPILIISSIFILGISFMLNSNTAQIEISQTGKITTPTTIEHSYVDNFGNAIVVGQCIPNGDK